jgi:hypothetical protein
MATVSLRVVDVVREQVLLEENVADVQPGIVQPQNDDTPHRSDGTNGNENVFKGPACTNALHKAVGRAQWQG